MSEKTVELVCDWCTSGWHEGDPEGDWFTYAPEFGEEDFQFCGMPCLVAWL